MTYIAEIDANAITYLAWAAGFAAGNGNTDAADALQNVLASIQLVELPDDEAGEVAFDVEAEDNVAQMDEYRAPDPMFTPPPPPPGPINNPDDFGAGPPPAGGLA
jgi:hypothetical protein